jgi:hypothetical protein
VPENPEEYVAETHLWDWLMNNKFRKTDKKRPYSDLTKWLENNGINPYHDRDVKINVLVTQLDVDSKIPKSIQMAHNLGADVRKYPKIEMQPRGTVIDNGERAYFIWRGIEKGPVEPGKPQTKDQGYWYACGIYKGGPLTDEFIDLFDNIFESSRTFEEIEDMQKRKHKKDKGIINSISSISFL